MSFREFSSRERYRSVLHNVLKVLCTTEFIAEHISTRLWNEDQFSQSMYVHTYMHVVGHTQECHAECHYIHAPYLRRAIGNDRYRPYVRHAVWHIQICSTQINVVDCGQRHSLAMEMEDGDDVGPPRFGYYKHQTVSPTARAMHASPAPAYDARTQSAHWREAKMHIHIHLLLN